MPMGLLPNRVTPQEVVRGGPDGVKEQIGIVKLERFGSIALTPSVVLWRRPTPSGLYTLRSVPVPTVVTERDGWLNRSPSDGSPLPEACSIDAVRCASASCAAAPQRVSGSPAVPHPAPPPPDPQIGTRPPWPRSPVRSDTSIVPTDRCHSERPTASARSSDGCGRRCSPSTPRTSRSLACQSTGLDDFGGSEHRPGLRALTGSLEAEARLTPAGRYFARGQVLTSLVNRLRLEQAWAETPAILQGALPAPIVIIGLPRTGTTLLQHLLAQDPAHRCAELGGHQPGPTAAPGRRRRPTDRGVRARHEAARLPGPRRSGAAPGGPHAAHRVRDPVLQQLRQPRARHDQLRALLPALLSRSRHGAALRLLPAAAAHPPVARPSGAVAAEVPGPPVLGGRAARCPSRRPHRADPSRPARRARVVLQPLCGAVRHRLRPRRPAGPRRAVGAGLGRGARADPSGPGRPDPTISSSTSTTPTSSAIRWAPCGQHLLRVSTSSSAPTPNRACAATSTSTPSTAPACTGTRSSSSGWIAPPKPPGSPTSLPDRP